MQSYLRNGAAGAVPDQPEQYLSTPLETVSNLRDHVLETTSLPPVALLYLAPGDGTIKQQYF